MKITIKKIKKTAMYFSRHEREKRIFSLYARERNNYECLSDRELSARYVDIKARYEFKKNILSVFVGAIFITVLTGAWSSFFKFANHMLQLLSLGESEPEKVGKVGLILFSTLFCFLILIVAALLTLYLRSLYRLQKKLLIIEEIRKSRG